MFHHCFCKVFSELCQSFTNLTCEKAKGEGGGRKEEAYDWDEDRKVTEPNNERLNTTGASKGLFRFKHNDETCNEIWVSCRCPYAPKNHQGEVWWLVRWILQLMMEPAEGMLTPNLFALSRSFSWFEHCQMFTPFLDFFPSLFFKQRFSLQVKTTERKDENLLLGEHMSMEKWIFSAKKILPLPNPQQEDWKRKGKKAEKGWKFIGTVPKVR